MPKQRRLDPDEVKETEAMLNLGVNKKLLQLHVQQTTGKAVTLKDLTNIKTAMDNKFTKSDIIAVVKQLKEIKGNIKVPNS